LESRVTVHPNAQLRTPRILIVEDETLLAEMIAEVIRGLGYVVSGCALNLSKARHELAKQNFDAVLLDIGMLSQSYSEIADMLQERGKPFAFVTAYNGALAPRHASVPLLSKPFTIDQLEALLQTLVGSPPSTNEVAK
jgi:CheY-like chemotaxis protein